MASSSLVLSEEQFQCSVCLNMFTEPVSIPCGHNYCKACIRKYWETTDLCLCPMCKEIFHKKPALRKTSDPLVITSVKFSQSFS
uniref:RING-type domain-containing protein n=1 Tax=Esox lucius TaxID=8010 RepID=A0AAY5K5L8_ESOLU